MATIVFLFVHCSFAFLLLSFNEVELDDDSAAGAPTATFPLGVSPATYKGTLGGFTSIYMEPAPARGTESAVVVIQSLGSRSLDVLVPSCEVRPGVVAMRPPDASYNERLGGTPDNKGESTEVEVGTPVEVIGQLVAPIVIADPVF